MKKIFALLLLTSSASWGAVAYEQSASSMPPSNTSTTTISKAYGSNVKAGSLLVAIVVWRSNNDPTGTRPTLTDSLGQTWTRIVEEDNTDANGGPSQYHSIGIWSFENSAAGANTVTATFGTSISQDGMVISEYSGIATSSSYDVSASSRQADPGPSGGVSSSSATTTSNGDLIVGANLDTFGGNPGFTAGPNFTQRLSVEDPVDGGTGWVTYEDYITQPTAGSIAGTFTKANGGGNDTTAMAAFKASGGSPAVTSSNKGFIGQGTLTGGHATIQ